MTPVGEAVDLDVSGSKISPWERPELGPWLRNPHLFDVMVFRSIDRLSRNIHDFMELLKWAEDNNKQMICLEPDIDFSSPIGRVIAIILALFADLEAKAISARVTGARVHMRSRARWGAGRVPYGYRLCPHPDGAGYALEPDPETSPIVREAVTRIIAGEPMLAIARDFNEREIPTGQEVARTRKAMKNKPDNKKADVRANDPRPRARWQVPALRRILLSESLRAVVMHKGTPVRGDDGMPLRYGPPLVSDQEFRAVQDAIAKRGEPDRAGRPAKAPLVGLLRCGSCGERLYRSETNTKRSTKTHVSYRCQAKSSGVNDCSGSSITAAEVETYVENEFLKMVGHMPLVIRAEDPGEDHRHEITEVEASIGDLERDRYEGGLFKGEKGVQRYRSMMTRLESRLEQLQAIPFRPAGVKWLPTKVTYRQEWNMTDWQVRRERMKERGVKVVVNGMTADAEPHPERLDFECLGVDLAQLASEGHDDTSPAEHWS